ncbi:MAG TPA: hypothetical protein VGB85_19945 [Nannocystis sp.]|jgi:3-oxoacyl-[acyl-carrier-protein] synthase-1
MVVSIVGVGLACPVGLTSKTATAAIRAGISRFQEIDEVVGPGGPVRASMLAQLGADRSRTERATFFARHALCEAVGGLGTIDALPCFFALPEPDLGPRINLEDLLRGLADVPTRAGSPLRLSLRPEAVVTAGRAGVFAALEKAIATFVDGGATTALIGGFDTLVDPETLDALAEQDRLLGRTNLDGIIPGEAAAFIVLSALDAPSRRSALARISVSATAHEPLSFARANDRASASDGLTSVFRSLRAAVDGRADRVYAGVTGEGYFGQEFAHASLRNAALMPEPLRCEPVSDALGDIGAAAGAVCLVQAVRAAAGQRSLVYASSDGGLVGGCVVEPTR